MHGEFDEEPELQRSRRDTELTLNFTTLLCIFFGMVLLCGLFFGLGFAAGRYGPNDSATAGQQGKAAGQASLEASSRPKPSAIPQNPNELQRGGSNPPQSAPSYVSQQDTSPAPAQAVVKPALPVQTNSTQPAGAAPAVPTMVQIAAVSHQEDADVLVSALRKRGYAVTARRQPADSLIHVQVGPFANRNDAEAMRQKLLNDGYNAIVQQ
jgi:cell division septation protein DedD